MPKFKELTKKLTWLKVLATVGVISILSVIISLFIITHPQKQKFAFSNKVNLDNHSLLTSLSFLSDGNIVQGGEIEILSNGDNFYPAILNDIRRAKKSINFSAYIWKDGQMSDQFFEALTTKAKEGVEVRLLLDGFGAKDADKTKIENLKNAGGKVAWFHPLHFGELTKIHKRNHTRAITIDDVSYTGGAAVADYWQGDADSKDHWHDLMFRLNGNIANVVKITFAKLWEISSGEVLTNIVLDNENNNKELSSISLTSIVPNEDTEFISTHFLSSIYASQKSILITTPYLILDNRMEDALIETAKRGVLIKILLPGPVIDSKIVQSATQYYYKRLLEAGIKIYEYQPTMLHAKYMVVDNTLSIIGSANFDTRSTFFNAENIIDIQNNDFAQNLTTLFENDLNKSKEITLSDWQKRNIFRPVFEFFSSLIDKQL